MANPLISDRDVEFLLLHSVDYLSMFSIVVVAWQWLQQATAAKRANSKEAFYRGKLAAAQYWIKTELPKIEHLAALCSDGEDSYLDIPTDAF